MPDFKETLIRIDHEAGTAEVWTEDRRTKTLLGKRRFKQIRQQAKGVWYQGTLDQISFRNPQRARLISGKEGQAKRGVSAGLAAYQAKRRAAKAEPTCPGPETPRCQTPKTGCRYHRPETTIGNPGEK